MKRISAAEAVRHFSELSDQVLQQPVVVTRNGRDRMVLVSVEHMEQLITLAINAADRPDEADALKKMQDFVAQR